METKEQIIEDEEYEALCEETIELIREIYKDHAAGGALHIVLDDGNVGSYHIQWCIDYSIKEDCEPAEKEMFLKCANNLLKMEEHQRDVVIGEAFKQIL